MPMRYHVKTMSSSTGTARKNSTTNHAGHLTEAWSESLAAPSAKPKTEAPTMATAAIFSVFSSPSTMSTRT